MPTFDIRESQPLRRPAKERASMVETVWGWIQANDRQFRRTQMKVDTSSIRF